MEIHALMHFTRVRWKQEEGRSRERNHDTPNCNPEAIAPVRLLDGKHRGLAANAPGGRRDQHGTGRYSGHEAIAVDGCDA